DELGFRPTYLLSYPVATDDGSISILKEMADGKRCEIGTHCHPWNTPPFNGIPESMICNLPADLQRKKISTLHYKIRDNFGLTPVSFRAGRWGYSKELAQILNSLGYKVDSSVAPFIDWREIGGPDNSDILPQPYRFTDDIRTEDKKGCMVEVPITISFFQSNSLRCNRIMRLLHHKYLKPFHVMGIAYRLNLINRVWLSPEFFSLGEMIKLTRILIRRGHEYLNMPFHSSALLAGATHITKSKDDEVTFLKKIRDYLIFARDEGISSTTLSEMDGLL
ncbi:MAG TPA: hypothetical protein VEJ88_05495, partial [Dissulfurispiraceae bacterium]|nr:hypothetical protein [Dissulfurispiraceae bacterium]